MKFPRCLLIAGVLALAACSRSQPEGQDPESAANAFFASVEKGNAQAAYDSAAFGFQAAQTYDAFASNAHELGLIGGLPPTWTGKQINTNDAKLEGTVVSQLGATVPLSVTLTRDGGVWKLFALHDTDPQAGASENRFTLVGKGTGFNDVYHQPMPSPGELSDLVHSTLTKFNAAITTGTFDDFYTGISKQWKDGQRMSGGAAAGVTEKMLHDHFAGFMDQKINISGALNGEVHYVRTPIINQDGLLDMDGYIDTPQFRVNFQLEYAYELPRWRLFGINLSLTK